MSACVFSSTVSGLQQSGLSIEDYCYLKCWVALVRVGKLLLTEIFGWGFTNPQQVALRDALAQLPGYSNTKYKIDFNKDERAKIESGSVVDFDITLLYTITQRLCRLVPATEQISANTSTKKLSDLLLKVKNTRNKFAHPLLGLTETEMANHVNEMRLLFEQVVDEAHNEFQVDSNVATNLKNEISSQLLEIINSPLPASTIAEQMTQIANEKVRIVLQEGMKDLQDSCYRHTCEVSVTPWPFLPVRRKLEEVFMKMKLQFSSSYSLQNRLTEAESQIDVDNILSVVHLDSTKPGLILLTGQSGIGKSTLLKYLIYSWLNPSSTTLNNIEQYFLILYIDCRDSHVTSLQDLFVQIMPNTSNLFTDQELRNIIMSQKCLFLLDNLDEISKQSVSVVGELSSSTSSGLKIIATATQDPGNQILQKFQHRRPINLTLAGLTTTCTKEYVHMLHASLPTELRRAQIDHFFLEILSDEKLLQDWLTNPEILSHVFFNWCFAPQQSSRCSTLTHVLLQSFNLILKKLKDRLLSRSLLGVMELHVLQIKLQTFLLELGRIAISSMREGTSGLSFKTTSQLLLKCQELGLPANVLLSEFLCFRETFDEKMLQTSVRVSFPSISFQEFCSAYHLYNLVVSSEENVNLEEILSIGSLLPTKSNKSRITNIMKFLVGLITTSDGDVLMTLSSQVLNILQEFCEVKKSSQWFQILEEAQGYETLSSAIIEILGGNWQVEDSGISALVVEMIGCTPPDTLTLVAVKDPSTMTHFKAALDVCRSAKRCIKLSLYIYSHFWKCEGQLSDDYLEAVCSEGSHCQLENFAGCLSSSQYSAIPNSIKRLAIQLKSEDIKELNKVLPNLVHLQLLSLTLSFNDNTSREQLESVNVHKGTMLSIDLWGVSQSSTDHFCEMVAAVSINITRLALRRTTLDMRSTAACIKRLNTAGVSLGSLVVGSTTKLAQHHNVNLAAAARDLLGCREFKWIEL